MQNLLYVIKIVKKMEVIYGITIIFLYKKMKYIVKGFSWDFLVCAAYDRYFIK